MEAVWKGAVLAESYATPGVMKEKQIDQAVDKILGKFGNWAFSRGKVGQGGE